MKPTGRHYNCQILTTTTNDIIRAMMLLLIAAHMKFRHDCGTPLKFMKVPFALIQSMCNVFVV